MRRPAGTANGSPRTEPPVAPRHGMIVVNPGGLQFGMVTGFVRNERDLITGIVIDTGVDDRQVAVPIAEVVVEAGAVLLPMTEDQFADLPRYKG